MKQSEDSGRCQRNCGHGHKGAAAMRGERRMEGAFYGLREHFHAACASSAAPPKCAYFRCFLRCVSYLELKLMVSSCVRDVLRAIPTHLSRCMLRRLRHASGFLNDTTVILCPDYPIHMDGILGQARDSSIVNRFLVNWAED